MLYVLVRWMGMFFVGFVTFLRIRDSSIHPLYLQVNPWAYSLSPWPSRRPQTHTDTYSSEDGVALERGRGYTYSQCTLRGVNGLLCVGASRYQNKCIAFGKQSAKHRVYITKTIYVGLIANNQNRKFINLLQ